jgi:hypothetical protein
VFFYTDGLVERRDRPLLDGLPQLLAVIGALGPVSPEDLCQAVLAGLGSDASREDDVAVIAVRRRVAERRGQEGPLSRLRGA